MPQIIGDEFRRVIMRGIEFPWKDKEPFVVSGSSVHGAIEVHHESGKIRCHECGEWWDYLGAHVERHGITAREYKLKHGLRLVTPLVSRSVHNNMSAAQSQEQREAARLRMARGPRNHSGQSPRKMNASHHELRNEIGSCMEQAISKLRVLADRLGHWPTRRDIEGIGLSVVSLLRLFGVRDMKSLWTTVGLAYGPTPRQDASMAKGLRFTDAFLIEVLRDFKPRYGRYPTTRDCGIRLPNKYLYDQAFGGFDKAMIDAGLAQAIAS